MNILFKYMRSRHLQSCLESHTFAFQTAAKQNDPFESSIESTIHYLKTLTPVPYNATMPCRKVKLGLMSDVFVNPLYDEFQPTREENKKNSVYNESLKNALGDLERVRDQVGLMSMSSDSLNVVMWAHYGDNHSGVCLGIDPDHLWFKDYHPKDAFWQRFGNIFQFGRMDYLKERPKFEGISSEEYIQRAYFSKYLDWSYEREFRLLRPLSECIRDSRLTPLLRFPPDCIRAVLLGMNFSGDEKEAIRLANKLGASVARIQLIRDEYRLDLQFLSGDEQLIRRLAEKSRRRP